jgi:hypothetical protein
VLEDRLVEPTDGLALALEKVDLGLHEGRLAGDVHERVRGLGDLLGVRAPARGERELVDGGRELVDRGGATRLVAAGLRLGLRDQELDLVDLALDRVRFRDESAGQLLRRSGCGDRRVPKDLSPPAS